MRYRVPDGLPAIEYANAALHGFLSHISRSLRKSSSFGYPSFPKKSLKVTRRVINCENGVFY